MNLVAIVGAALSVGILSFAVLDVMFSEQQRVRRRLESLGAYSAGAVAEAQPLVTPFRDRILRPAVTYMSRGIGAIAPRGYLKRLRDRLITAGTSSRIGPERFVMVKIFVAIGIFALVGVAMRVAGLGLGSALLFAIIAALLVSYVPDIILGARVSGRQRNIAKALPDMLDMLTISVEAGLGFDQSVSKYVQNASGPLAEEFGMTLREIQAGKSRRDALRALGDRASVAELRAFIMAIVQADVFGVSISEVLRTQSHEMRLKRRQRAEEFAQKAPAKMVFPLILCIMPATLIVVMGPAIIRIASAFFRV